MKILAIGGCGSMARYALKAAQNFDAINKDGRTNSLPSVT